MLGGELFPSFFFDVDKKEEKKLKIWELFYFSFALCLVLWLCNNLDICDIVDLGL